MSQAVRSWKFAALAAAWGAVVFATLQLRHVASDDHYVCGIWGCGPPLAVLIAMHAFWLSVLALPVTLGCLQLSRRRLFVVSLLVTVAAAAGITAVVVRQFTDWYPKVGEFAQEFLLERCLFSIAVLTDAPLVQSLLAGLVGLFVAWIRRPATQTPDIIP